MRSYTIKSLGIAALILSLTAAIGCGKAEGENAAVVPPAVSNDIQPSGNADTVTAPTGDEDEVIVPAETSTPEATDPEIESPKTPETPPAPPAALTVSLVGSKTLYEKKEGLIQISYSRTGGGDVQQLYIYGPFSGDSDCDGGLVIDPSGYDLNKGSANYLKYQSLLSGEVCKDLDGNCMDYFALEAPGLFYRINLSGESGTFYTRIHEKSAKYVLVGQAEDGTWTKDEKTFKAPADKPMPPLKPSDTVAYAPWSSIPLSGADVPAADPCGDGKVDAGEACDDGNTAPDDGCYRCRVDNGWNCQPLLFETKSTCTRFNFECGDGVLETIDGEQCDDKNDDPNDGCYNCVIQPGWDCSYSMFTFTNTCWKI